MIDVLAATVTVILIELIYQGRSGLPRILLALGFALFVPGRAIVANWPRMARWSEVAMPMVLSLAVLTLLATTELWAHFWQPLELFQVEAGLSLVGLAVGAARRHRHRRSISTEHLGSWSRILRRR